jgi:DNA polymerase III epsilon subunit-like protein
MFIDLETSGLDLNRCQILEVGMVKVEGTTVQMNDTLHFYLEWPQVTYETKALDLFGDRRKDRRKDVPIVNPAEGVERIRKYMDTDRQKWNLGGKNLGKFDFQFLTKYCDGFETLVHHSFIDIGNKYEDPWDLNLPKLEVCRDRGVRCGVAISGDSVTHTALEDAVLCAELYVGWLKNLVNPLQWRHR